MTAKYLILSAFLASYSPVIAQQFPDLIFTNLSTRDGLSSNNITFITQDSSGFIWIGTDDGLNRFDGKRFIIYRQDPLNNNSLPNSQITSIAIERSGLLWIGTTNGLCSFDPVVDSFKIYWNILGRPYVDHKNNTWVASNHGLLFLTEE